MLTHDVDTGRLELPVIADDDYLIDYLGYTSSYDMKTKTPEAKKKIEDLISLVGLEDKIHAQVEEIKGLKRAIETFKARETAGETERFLYGARTIGGLHVITASVPDADAGKLRQMGDTLRDKASDVVAVLSSVNGEKITFSVVKA